METKRESFDVIYSKVIAMVEEGCNIYEALITLKVDRVLFYKNMTKQQRLELQMVKTLNTQYGVGYNLSKTPKQKK